MRHVLKRNLIRPQYKKKENKNIERNRINTGSKSCGSLEYLPK